MCGACARDRHEMSLLQNEVITTQSTETMSLPLSSMSAVTTFLWVVYGVLQWDFYVIVSSVCWPLAWCEVHEVQVSSQVSYCHEVHTHTQLPSPPLPLQAPNALGLLLSCIQLLLFIVYWQTPRKRVVSLDKPI